MIPREPSHDILVVDDNPMNLGVLSGMLQEHGYQVRIATNGRRGLEAARHRKPDLVMMDISMPDMDGFEACAALKQDPLLASVPVIFLSAHDQPLDKVKAFTVGGADYIQKPFQLQEVLIRVAYQLRLASLQAALQEKNRDLEEANARLQELDRLKAKFTAMLVHDLRNPMGAVNNIIELLGGQGTLPPEDAQLLDKASVQVRKCLTFLNELLEVYRSEAQALELDLQPLDPGPFLEGFLETAALEVHKRGLSLASGLAPDLPRIQGDAARLERVLGNLVTNATKFTPAGGTISVRADTLAGEGIDAGRRWVRMEVQDSGRGIPASQLPFIFDPYRQALAKDAHLGTGLGLAIAANIVAGHQGRIQVQSQEGVGTCFTILLPAPS